MPKFHLFDLMKASRQIDDSVVSGSGIASYLKAVLGRLVSKFNMKPVLSDPCEAYDFFTTLNCSKIDLVAYNPSKFNSIFVDTPRPHFRQDLTPPRKRHGGRNRQPYGHRRLVGKNAEHAPVLKAGCKALINHAQSKCAAGG